jgi:hypothetical protein
MSKNRQYHFLYILVYIYSYDKLFGNINWNAIIN